MKWINHLPGMDAGRHPAKVDVFHWTDFTFPTVRSCATVMTMHDAAFAVDPTFHGWETSRLLDRVRRHMVQADVVLVPTAPTLHDAELLGLDPQQVHVVPHGVSPFFCPPEDKHAPRDYLLTVSTIEPRKNYPRILKALERGEGLALGVRRHVGDVHRRVAVEVAVVEHRRDEVHEIVFFEDGAVLIVQKTARDVLQRILVETLEELGARNLDFRLARSHLASARLARRSGRLPRCARGRTER